ncbi:MAG: sodium:solute symporter [Acidobacteriota bacterium]|nr:sodium:solute symporter [Acidobacteriota bacterium]
MRPLDWVSLVATLAGLILYGLYRSRGSKTINEFLLAGRTMPWYAMGLSIMATQASAITFISTTGQAYVDGLRFVQFYFGLPIAMVILSATAVPIFARARVYTAYEYLEKRFDAKTRALASAIFLIQRGLGVGVAIAAPSIVLSVIFGWDDRITTLIIGLVIVLYTTFGGILAITWADVLQMSVIFCGLIFALILVISMLPPEVSFIGAVRLAGAAGRLNAIDLHFDWNNRYNIWSGLIGGTFLALSYFGTDQSQVQRYLTGKSIAQSKLSLLFNGIAKVPLQCFILFVGAMVFVFYLFEAPPLLFQKPAMDKTSQDAAYPAIAAQYRRAFEARRQAAFAVVRSGAAVPQFREAQKQFDSARARGIQLAEKAQGSKYNDTNYIFLSFVTKYLPAGLVGLIIAVIFAAAMSSSSGEINSLATVSVIDIYKRHIRPEATDRHYLTVSRVATAFWGLYAMFFAQYGKNLGSLVEVVNLVGSLFYGSLLGVFTLAFFFKRVTGTAAFWSMLAGEAAIFAAFFFTHISFLWYNVIGCLIVIGTAHLFRRSRT